jgi:hypothetical protein
VAIRKTFSAVTNGSLDATEAVAYYCVSRENTLELDPQCNIILSCSLLTCSIYNCVLRNIYIPLFDKIK